jgi:hypothetical protein
LIRSRQRRVQGPRPSRPGSKAPFVIRLRPGFFFGRAVLGLFDGKPGAISLADSMPVPRLDFGPKRRAHEQGFSLPDRYPANRPSVNNYRLSIGYWISATWRTPLLMADHARQGRCRSRQYNQPRREFWSPRTMTCRARSLRNFLCKMELGQSRPNGARRPNFSLQIT